MKRLAAGLAGALAMLTAAVALLLWATPLGARWRASPKVGAGYAAEMACAGVFVTGRPLAQVMAEDIAPIDPLLGHARLTQDADSVTAELFGLGRRTALYRPGLGCTLVGAGGVAALKAQAAAIAPLASRERPQPWPAGDQVKSEEWPSLAKALDDAMAAGDGVHGRALIVVHNGHIVAERYAGGFTPASLFLGWSMSKSVTGALIGTLVGQGKLALDAPAPVSAWNGDARHAITLHQLLDMTSGLKFVEDYRPGDDVTRMLYQADDMAAAAAAQPLLHQPGQSWAYSSGTANILARIATDAAGGDLAAMTHWARTRLFEPAGITSAQFAADGAGTLVGSSYLYMTARDWARFGQIYLNDGVIGWQRILPAEWVAASRRPAATADGHKLPYARQFWLNGTGADDRVLGDCPPDLFWADGHNGQRLFIIPSAHAVILRLGWDTGSFDQNRHVAALLQALNSEE